MTGLLVAFVVLLGLTGYFVGRPLFAEQGADEGAEATQSEGLSGEERAVIERELRWRLEHDLASGRLNQEEYDAQKASLDQRTATAAGD